MSVRSSNLFTHVPCKDLLSRVQLDEAHYHGNKQWCHIQDRQARDQKETLDPRYS